MLDQQIFVEVDHSQYQKNGNKVCGDVFLSRKMQSEQRTLLILSDGLGSGIKANILATMTASIGMGLTSANAPLERTVNAILKALPLDKRRKISYATFTIVDIHRSGTVQIIEFGNPAAFYLHKGQVHFPQMREIKLDVSLPGRQGIGFAQFRAHGGDRIVLYTDGVTQSGMGSNAFPFGWGDKACTQFCRQWLKTRPEAPAGRTAEAITQKALENDGGIPHDDMTASVVYFRRPRQLLICTGPPYHDEDDATLARRVDEFAGTKIICGGTTAQIIGRELNRPLEVDLKSAGMGLPPASTMPGADLVTEGVLTLDRLVGLLQTQPPKTENSPAGQIIKQLIAHDEITIITGTRLNNAHHNPRLPQELGIRRYVVKRIVNLLEQKHLKKVKMELI